MKKLIQKIFFFILPILIILLCVELFYRIVPNTFSTKNEDIKRKYNSNEVLIFGNSHTFYGLNPKFFSKQTYNLAIISQTLYFDELLFDKYLCKFKKLDFIILNIDYESLSELDNGDEDVWRKYYYKSYMDLNVPLISKIDLHSVFLSSTRNFYDNVKLLKRYFLDGSIVDCDENGFGINYTKKNRMTNIKEITPFTINRHEDNSTNFTHNLKRIQLIINKCKSKNVKVLLVTMPMTSYYFQGVNKFKLNKIFNSCLLLKKSNQNVYYLNLFQDKRFTNDDFHDPDHLHNEGAKKCSIIVNDFINNNEINFYSKLLNISRQF